MQSSILGFLLGNILCYITKQYSYYYTKEMTKMTKKQCLLTQAIVIGIIEYSKYRTDSIKLYSILLGICCILLIIDMIDTMTMYIPDSLLAVAIIGIIIYTNDTSIISMPQRILGMIICSIPMVLINIYVKEAFGGGDIKLITIFGYLLGYQQILLAMIIAIITGGFYAFWLLYIKKEKRKYIPFAPFLCKSILLVIFFGKEILVWYFGIVVR